MLENNQAGPQMTSPTAPQAKASFRALLHEMLETVLLALVIFAALRFFVQNFRIEGQSMEPTLHDGQFLIVDKISYRLGKVKRGDIVIFNAPPAPDKDFVKRVIGLPGEMVEVRLGVVYINGQPLDEPYIVYGNQRSWGPRRVGEDEYFVLGDNRNNSVDSHGGWTVPRESIVGRAWIIYWPPSRWGVVNNYPLVAGTPASVASR